MKKTDRRLILDLTETVCAKRYRKDRSLDYAVRSLEKSQERARKYSTLSDINKSIKKNLIDIYNNNLYEIYVCNSEPVEYCGELKQAGAVGGWDIKWILAPNKAAIKKYPFFDCIISKNDNSTGMALDAEIFTG